MKINNIENIEKCGVYEIRNTQNNKMYVGSTKMSFLKRLQHHLSMLKRNTHKNSYLQNSWNKHGQNSFEFNILEITDKNNTLFKEQLWIDKTKCVEVGYNINPLASGTPNLSKEIIEKRTKTFTKTMTEAMNYYYQIKSREITIQEIPEKYKKLVQSRIDYIPWNKEKKGYKTNYPKNRKSFSRAKIGIKMRNKNNNIEVYKENKLIKTYNSVSDLHEKSLQKDFKLIPWMVLRNPNGRNGLSPYILSMQNIGKSCKTGKPYKGLIFKHSPS